VTLLDFFAGADFHLFSPGFAAIFDITFLYFAVVSDN